VNANAPGIQTNAEIGFHRIFSLEYRNSKTQKTLSVMIP
jgi:hypothetical protein